MKKARLIEAPSETKAHHDCLIVLHPSDGECWRLAFSVHASAISQVLDQEMQLVASASRAEILCVRFDAPILNRAALVIQTFVRFFG